MTRTQRHSRALWIVVALLTVSARGYGQSREFWQQHFTFCGDGAYFADSFVGEPGSDRFVGRYEYRGLRFTDVPRQITNIDRLNGIEQIIEMRVSFEATRLNNGDGTTSDWVPGSHLPYVMRITRNGRTQYRMPAGGWNRGVIENIRASACHSPSQEGIKTLRAKAIDARRAQFFDAIRLGDTLTVERMLQSGFDVRLTDPRDGYGNVQPLPAVFETQGAVYGKMIRLLVEAGADVNVRADRFGGTYPLQAAVGRCYSWGIGYLLDHGAKVTDERSVKAYLQACDDSYTFPAASQVLALRGQRAFASDETQELRTLFTDLIAIGNYASRNQPDEKSDLWVRTISSGSKIEIAIKVGADEEIGTVEMFPFNYFIVATRKKGQAAVGYWFYGHLRDGGATENYPPVGGFWLDSNGHLGRWTLIRRTN